MNTDRHESTSPRPSVRAGLATTAEREKRLNSRAKGARGERQWRDELRANGYAARRGQQFAGSADSPDVVCDALDWIHFEVKAVERLNIEDAMEQARRDAAKSETNPKAESRNDHPEGSPSPRPSPPGEGESVRRVPVVAHRRNFRPWLVTMEAETFFRLLRGDFTGDNGGNGGEKSEKQKADRERKYAEQSGRDQRDLSDHRDRSDGAEYQI